MPEIFFISDTHFGHEGIIRFSETRPFRLFDTIEEHDKQLIKRWNHVVRPKDVVWHLGDVVFGRRNLEIINRLNGRKKLILGNHDIYGIHEYAQYFEKIYGVMEYKGMILSHIPVHPCQLNRYYMNIHGHLHEKKIDDWRYVNVSCEQINLTPIPFDLILDVWGKNN